MDLLTGKFSTTASKTPRVPVTAPSRVVYFPSAVARSMMDWEATGVTAAARKERVARNFMVCGCDIIIEYLKDTDK